MKLKCADVTFNPEGMVVKIESSKTDQYRDGASVVIARTGQVTCPVGMMERYCRMGEVDHSSQAKLFRGIVQNKGGERLRKNGGLSYTRLRELLLDKLSELGFDPTLFGMHSLRGWGCHCSCQHRCGEQTFQATWPLEVRISQGWLCERLP